jgi:LysR substrate binding domain
VTKFSTSPKGEADIAIRLPPFADDALVRRKIVDQPWAIYATHAYAERHGRITRFEDINDHSVIAFDGAMRNHHAARWLRTVAPNSRVAARSDSVPSLLFGVKSGAGLLAIADDHRRVGARTDADAGRNSRGCFLVLSDHAQRYEANASRAGLVRFSGARNEIEPTNIGVQSLETIQSATSPNHRLPGQTPGIQSRAHVNGRHRVDDRWARRTSIGLPACK